MDYSFPDPPNHKSFHSMTKKEAEAYFGWFVSAVPIRISILEQFIISHPDERFHTWRADRSLHSLLVLGEWLATQVEKQTPSEEFKQMLINYRTSSPLFAKYPQIGLPDIEWIPSDKTMALTIDIGMYIGQIFIEHIYDAKWILMRQGKSNIDYNQPVIGGMVNALNHVTVHCNTRGIVHTIALSYLDKTRPPDALFTVCNRWINNMQQRNLLG